MGAVVSRPKIPRWYPVPNNPPNLGTAPVTAPPSVGGGGADSTDLPTGQGGGSDSPASGGSGTPANSRAERERSLLRRARGQAGTVLTGYRGLAPSDLVAGRKTLLGE